MLNIGHKIYNWILAQQKLLLGGFNPCQIESCPKLRVDMKTYVKPPPTSSVEIKKNTYMFNTRVGNFPIAWCFQWIMIVQTVQIMYYGANVLLLETESWSLQVKSKTPSDASVSKNMPTGDTVERRPLNLLKIFKMRLFRSSSVWEFGKNLPSNLHHVFFASFDENFVEILGVGWGLMVRQGSLGETPTFMVQWSHTHNDVYIISLHTYTHL